MLILTFVVLGFALYLGLGFAFLYFREKGRIREHLSCIESRGWKGCAKNHHDRFYMDPTVGVVTCWPILLFHRIFFHERKPWSDTLAAKAEAAVKADIERKKMHTLVSGNGERDD